MESPPCMSHSWSSVETRERANSVLIQVNQRPLFYQGVFRDGRQSGGVCGDQKRQGSVLSQGLCEGIIRWILLHLWDHDAPVELF